MSHCSLISDWVLVSDSCLSDCSLIADWASLFDIFRCGDELILLTVLVVLLCFLIGPSVSDSHGCLFRNCSLLL
jgi:hypothetical protein